MSRKRGIVGFRLGEREIQFWDYSKNEKNPTAIGSIKEPSLLFFEIEEK
jgi:hypothetical protein